MQQAFSKSDFSIIMANGGVEDSSEFWQEQYQQSYDSIVRNLPEGSIKLLELEDSRRERADLVTIFSSFAVFGITGEVFVNIVLELFKTWSEFRPTAEIESKCPM